MLVPAQPTLETAASQYSDRAARLGAIYRSFEAAMLADVELLSHREHIETHQLGFGDRAFHWMWKLIVDDMPSPFRFLEIGVYKGQVLSLVNILARRVGKAALLFGVTPLGAVGDKYTRYDQANYAATIRSLEAWCGIPEEHRARLIVGLSTDDRVKAVCRQVAPFDVVYIDGGHDYHVVANDIVSYGELVGDGGFLVIDDASSELTFPPGLCWPGHSDVGRAVREILVPNPRFSEVIAVGHNRVWRKNPRQDANPTG